MTLQVLRLCLDRAVQNGWLKNNPARTITKLKESRTDIDPLSLEEIKVFLAHLPDEKWRRYFTVAFFAGLRPFEQIGLRWPAIDWQATRPQVIVRYGVTRRSGAGRLKTDSSYREVPMLPAVERALKAQCPDSQLRSEWVFPSERGGHLDITNLRERILEADTTPSGAPRADALPDSPHVRNNLPGKRGRHRMGGAGPGA